jgi:MFS family permease
MTSKSSAPAAIADPIEPAHTLRQHSTLGHDDDVDKKEAVLAEPASRANAGVSKVETFNKVLHQSGKSGKTLLWLLGTSVGLTMFVYALDQAITTQIYSAWASSSFGQHANLAAVSTASQIIRAISKPFLGKLADLTSRPTTYVVVLVFYVIGFVVAASAQAFSAYAVGVALTAAGKSGLDLLSDIIIGDLTPLEWRGFFSASLSLPFVLTVPVSGFMVDGLKGKPFYTIFGAGLIHR